MPASTAWPLVLAFGFTLLCAGLLTNVSVSSLGACAGYRWLRRLVPRSISTRTRRGCAGRLRSVSRWSPKRRIVERLPVAPEQVRAWLPVENLSRFRRCERRPSGQCSHGRAGLPLWFIEDGKHLVSHQSSCRRCVRSRQRLAFGIAQLNSFHAGLFFSSLWSCISSPSPSLWVCSMVPCFRCSLTVPFCWVA